MYHRRDGSCVNCPTLLPNLYPLSGGVLMGEKVARLIGQENKETVAQYIKQGYAYTPIGFLTAYGEYLSAPNEIDPLAISLNEQFKILGVGAKIRATEESFLSLGGLCLRTRTRFDKKFALKHAAMFHIYPALDCERERLVLKLRLPTSHKDHKKLVIRVGPVKLARVYVCTQDDATIHRHAESILNGGGRIGQPFMQRWLKRNLPPLYSPRAKDSTLCRVGSVHFLTLLAEARLHGLTIQQIEYEFPSILSDAQKAVHTLEQNGTPCSPALKAIAKGMPRSTFKFL